MTAGNGLHIASDDREHAILVADEDSNDIAEFYHRDHATVDQSYETALGLAQKLVGGVAQGVTPSNKVLADWLERQPRRMFKFGDGEREIVEPPYLLGSDADAWINVLRSTPAEGQALSALDNSQSLLVMIYHLGTEFAGIGEQLWSSEGLTELLAEQIKKNRTTLDASSQSPAAKEPEHGHCTCGRPASDQCETCKSFAEGRSQPENDAEALLLKIDVASFTEGTMHEAIRAAKDYVAKRRAALTSTDKQEAK